MTRLAALAVIVTLIAASFSIGRIHAQEATADDALDQQLLDDLGGDLLDGLDDLVDEPALEGRSPEDQTLEDDLGVGEDIGREGEDELTRIGRQMRQVEAKLASRELSPQTQQAQQRVIDQLDALIEELKKQQCQPSTGSGKPSPQAADSEQLKQPSDPNAGRSGGEEKPAQDSEEITDPHAPQLADLEAVQALIKEVWGHLPDRVRQEMQSTSGEEFVPEYEDVTREYFRRLAEEGAK